MQPGIVISNGCLSNAQAIADGQSYTLKKDKRGEESMSKVSCFSTSSRKEVLKKAEPDQGTRRRYLISAVLALIAFDSFVSWREVRPMDRSLTQDQAFLESTGYAR